MPWRPLPRIAFAVATYPFQPSAPTDLPLELGDELYIIEEGGADGAWFRGYLVAPPSLLSGLTSVKGQTLEARVFSGIFPRRCVEIRELLGETGVAVPEGGQGAPSVVERHGERSYGGGSPALGSSTAAGTLSPAPPKPWIQTNGANRALSSPTSSSRRTSGTGLLNSRSPTTARDPNARRPPAPVPMLKVGDETPTSVSEPLVDEISSCLREWYSTNLHQLLLSRNYVNLETLSKLVKQLDMARRQLLHGVLTTQELGALREKTVWDLVSGNKMLGNEIIVRDPARRGRLLTAEDSTVEVSKLQSTMGLLDKPRVPAPDQVNLHHLLVEIRELSQQSKETTTVSAYLCREIPKERPHPMTEFFSSEIRPQIAGGKAAKAGPPRTLFTNLTPMDIGDVPSSDARLYLVVRVQVGRLTQPAALMPSRAMTLKDSGTSRSDGHDDSSPVNSTPKGGRRSFMWGQNKLSGSQRHRGAAVAKVDEKFNHVESNETGGDTSRSSSSPTVSVSGQQAPRYVQRDVGIAVLPLKFGGPSGSVEQVLRVWTPSDSSPLPNRTEDGWDDLIPEIMTSRSGGYEESHVVSRVQLQLQWFTSPDPEDLIRVTPTLLHDIVTTPKLGFSGAPTKPRSDIYITLDKPNIPLHASFSHPLRGAAQLPGGFDMSSVQLALEVRRSSGSRVEHCIFPSSNSTGHTVWRTTAIRNGTGWGQTIKLVLASHEVQDCHLLMSITEAPGSPFALAWVPLWVNGAFIEDGKHVPLLYFYDTHTSGTTNGRGNYLDLPWDSTPRGKRTNGHTRLESLTGPLATVTIESYLCSTEFSQDQVLLRILQWKDQADDQLLILLRQLAFVPEIEIVKLLNQVFDALFGVLVDRAGQDEFEDLVFTALVTILGIVHDRRFNLGPLVDEYAETHFNYPFAAPCLLRSYLRLLSRPAEYQNARQLRATFKVGRLAIKFIIVARTHQKAKEAGIGITNTQSTFHQDFQKIFDALAHQMQAESATYIGSKTLIVQHMHTWLPELEPCFSPEEIFDIAVKFIDACVNVQGKLVLYKLILILNLAKAAKASNMMREELDTKIAAWINPYWGTTDEVDEQYRDQVRLCSSILSLQEGDGGRLATLYHPKIIQSYKCILRAGRPSSESLSLLFPSSYPFPTRSTSMPRTYDENLIELAGLLTSFGFFKVEWPVAASGEDLMIESLVVMLSVLSGDAYPSSWLTLHLCHHRAILKALDGFSLPMMRQFLPSPDDADEFRMDLWKAFLVTLLKLVRSEALALEVFPEQKRRAVWKVAGDIREQGAELLGRCWDALGWETDAEERRLYGLNRLGGYQVQYVPALVGPIMELCLSVHGGLRGVAVEILQSMVISEWTLNEDLAVIQHEMIGCLHNLFKSKEIGEHAQQKLFIFELMELFDPLTRAPDSDLLEAVKTLVAAVDELLDLLIAVHAPDSSESFRMMDTLRLLDFLRGMHKEDIFISYVHQLADVESKARCYKEAGLALRLHADLYPWDITEEVDGLKAPAYPRQTAFERKESLYFEMIKHFEEGAALDCALESYQELADQYERTSFDFAKLARTQRSMARLYELIAKGEAQSPRYFRVVYRGMGFPAHLRDKQFVFEGNGSERLGTFTDRLQQQHPAARFITGENVEDEEGQFLQVSAVTPYRDFKHPLYQRNKVAFATKEYLLSSRPKKFAVTTKRHSPSTGVKDQWVEKTVYTAAEAFPTVLRRSEIVAEEVVPLSPIQTAIERTARKTSELVTLGKRTGDGDESGVWELLDAVKASVDPAGSTSVAQYRAILARNKGDAADSEEEGEPQMQPLEVALQVALLDFVSTTKHSLALLSHSAAALQSEHQRLSAQFHSTFAPELVVLAPMQTPDASFAAWNPDPSFRVHPPSPKTPHFATEVVARLEPTEDSPALFRARERRAREQRTSPRKRLSVMLKRNASDQDPGRKATTNGTSHGGGHPLATDDGHSTGSNRADVYNRRTPSWQTSENGSPNYTPVTSRTRTRGNSRERPATGFSAATATSGKKGSIRQRFSALTLGRQGSRKGPVDEGRLTGTGGGH